MRQKTTVEDQKLIDEWLAKNKVTICETGDRTDPDDIVYTFKVGKRGKPKEA